MSPQPVANRRGRQHGVALAIAALIVSMLALSILGSAFWRPEPRARVTLELGAATPVGLSPRPAGDSIAGVLDVVAPAVVFITIADMARSGSGVVVHESGFVVTNAHVVDGARQVRVAFEDGTEYDAEVYGLDTATDLAVLAVDADEPLPVAPLGDSDALKVGEFVVALGAPFGLAATATSGIVSGLHRSGLGIARFEDFIVTDAPINRGNSGGPLVNLRGEVVGINTAIIAGEDDPHRLGTFAGVGFAIPVNVMRVVAQRLIGDGGLDGSTIPGDGHVNGGISDDDPGRSWHTGATGAVPIAAQRLSTTTEKDPPPESFVGRGIEPPDGSVAFLQTWDEAGNRRERGSAFVVRSGGSLFLVTNEHVVRGATEMRAFFHQDDPLGFGRRASLLVADPGFDLALLTLDDESGLEPLRVGDAGTLTMNDPVVALGMRAIDGGLTLDTGTGHITGMDLKLQGLPTRALILATDIRIRVGDSGGPLLDRNGDVVGVMVARETDENSAAAAADRLSYAVALRPQDLQTLIDDATDPGFDPGFQHIWGDEDGPFILVLTVDEDGQAAQLGLQRNDRIVAIDGQPVPVGKAGQRAIYFTFLRLEPGTTVRVDIERPREGGDPERVSVDWQIPARSPVP